MERETSEVLVLDSERDEHDTSPRKNLSNSNSDHEDWPVASFVRGCFLQSIAVSKNTAILHQTAVEKPFWGRRGLAKALFGQFPTANVYNDSVARWPGSCHPACISVEYDNWIVSLSGQLRPGRPKWGSDDFTKRRNWPKTALLSLFDWVRSHFDTPPSFVAPARMASGLAGDDPVEVRQMVGEVFRQQGHYLVWMLPLAIQDEAESSWDKK